MPSYRLTNAATEDLRQIMEYTLGEWGAEQVIAYRDRLESRLTVLARFPETGRSHVELSQDVLYVVEGKHYVFYQIADDGVEILRFLHARSDILRHLGQYL